MNEKLRRRTVIIVFAAIVAVLQCVATFINFGAFPITLTLIPIIVAGAVFGPFIGMIMGLVFGIVVAIMVVTGADPSGATMLAARPVVTISVCILKGALAGLLSACTYHLLKKKNATAAIVLASAVAPIVNTGTLFLCLITFFGSSFTVMLAALTSLNFIVELITNVLLAPGLLVAIHNAEKNN